jgi:membrane associated rhomboid family serine protease
MTETCYRHPDRETGVRCSNCERPICPDCMTPSPVGMRCPECSRQTTKVVRGTGGAANFGAAPATWILIGLNVAAFLAEIATGTGGLSSSSGSLISDFATQGKGIADGEVYRIVTGGFLHAGLFHIGLNMFALFVIGRLLEPGIGTARFTFLYAASLLAGSLGALLLSSPADPTVGASGAIFGIFGASFVIARARGLDGVASELGILLVINLVITIGVPGISIGGHLGGLIGGMICALIIIAGERGMLGARRLPIELALISLVGAIAIAGAIAVA